MTTRAAKTFLLSLYDNYRQQSLPYLVLRAFFSMLTHDGDRQANFYYPQRADKSHQEFRPPIDQPGSLRNILASRDHLHPESNSIRLGGVRAIARLQKHVFGSTPVPSEGLRMSVDVERIEYNKHLALTGRNIFATTTHKLCIN